MARRRDFDRLRATEIGRASIHDEAERIAAGTPFELHGDVAYLLRRLPGARLLQPHHDAPYWQVRSKHGRFLGSGKTPLRALHNAFARLRHPQ